MTKKAERNLKYTLATHDAEHMTPSRKAISLCEKIANGHISGDMAVRKSYVITESKAGTRMPDGFGCYDVYAVAGSSYCYAKDTSLLGNTYRTRKSTVTVKAPGV